MRNKDDDMKVLYGKGKEYSAVASEVEQTFRDWLAYAGLDEVEFDRRMACKPHRIEDRINENGDIEINIYAGFAKVIAPLVFELTPAGTLDQLDNFLVDVLLLLSYVASRYQDKSFEKVVKEFADRMVAERKMTLG